MAKNKVPAEVRAFFSKMGKLSADARMEKMTADQRSEVARQAATKRWAKGKVKK